MPRGPGPCSIRGVISITVMCIYGHCFCVCLFVTFKYLPENRVWMNSGSGEDAEGRSVFVRLVEKKSGTRVEWVLEMSEGERAAAGARSLDCAGAFAIANDPASLGMTNQEKVPVTNHDEMLGIAKGNETRGMTNQARALAVRRDETRLMTVGHETIVAPSAREMEELRARGA